MVILSIFSTVLFSVTLWPTASQTAPFALSTSFCGSMKTMAVSDDVRLSDLEGRYMFGVRSPRRRYQA